MDGSGRRYRIQEVLGSGGFGTVYRAELIGEAGFRKSVAIKLLHPGRDTPDRIARLRDEARMLARVRHRTIVGVDALIRLEGRMAIVMELVPGSSLDTVLALVGPLPPTVALEIVAEVAAGLAAAFGATEDGRPLRLLHRDVKPANVHITPDGAIKLLDFGIARADLADREAVTKERIYGSPPYLPPERLELVDVQAGDVFSLGVTCVELLLQARPDGVAARPAPHEARIGGLLARVEALAIDPGLAPLLRAMLAYDHEDRPAIAAVEETCRAIRARLQGPTLASFVGSLPGPPQPDAPGEWTGRLLSESTDDVARVQTDPPPALDLDNATFSMSLRSETAARLVPAASPRRRWPYVLAGLGAAGLAATTSLVGLLVVLWFSGVNRASCASTANEMRTLLAASSGDTRGGLAVAERVDRMCGRGELGLVNATFVLMQVQRGAEDGDFSADDDEDLLLVAEQYLGVAP